MAFIRKPKQAKKTEAADLDRDITSPDALLEFANKKGIETEPLDIVELVSQLDIKLRFEPMNDDNSGSLKKDKDGDWCMHVNSLHHPNRQRFTIAHELGHLFLHGKECNEFKDKIFFRNGQQDVKETQANNFAANLLMPADSFRKFTKTRSKKVEEIASYFGVSSLAVRYRAKVLGYSGHNV